MYLLLNKHLAPIIVASALALSCAMSVLAATPAGTVITNQAAAIYQDSNGQWRRVTSNIVETTVQQVAAMALASDQDLRAVNGGIVRFVHQVSNTGNGSDQFSLQVSNEPADDFDVVELSIYADSDNNGLPDGTNIISSTPSLAPGESFSFVIEGRIPVSGNASDSATLLLQATSIFDSTLVETNTDSVQIEQGAALRVSKQFLQTSGPVSGSTFETVISVSNVGTDAAMDVALLDALPAGMDYVAGSARLNGSSTILTDQDATDVQFAGTLAARYCAYDSSCAGLPESDLDADTDSTNQLTLLIDTLAAGESVSLRFSVTVDTDTGVDVLLNQAELQYPSSATGTEVKLLSNRALYRVLPTIGVVANGSTLQSSNGSAEPVVVTSAPQAGIVYFSNRIWNTGSRVDTFNMIVDSDNSSLPAGSSYELRQADAQTPLLDTNQDGIADTGPVPVGSFTTVVLAVQLPADAIGDNSGSGFSISKTAQSISDSRIFDSITDTLTQIVASSVDLTNVAPAGNPLATGLGIGPESDPVSVIPLNGQGLAVFDLFVRHSGEVPDLYLLSASATAAGAALPAGVKVNFINPASGLPVLSTGVLADGDSAHVQAHVQVSDAAIGNALSIYFSAVSPTTAVEDIKHDAVQGAVTRNLLLSPSSSASVSPGEFVVYKHRLQNTGNALIDDIELQTLHDQPAWTLSLFIDSDMNGVLSAADSVIPSALSLQAGEEATVFLKVFAPAQAPLQQRAISRLVALWDSGSRSTMIEDISTVSDVTVMVLKEQALDTGCDGAPDTADGFVTVPLAVEPGNNCVVYRLTATNQGRATSYRVAIHDSTPAYTRYSPPALCSHNTCQITEPVSEAQGQLKAVVNSLLSGESFRFEFSVRVE